MGQTPPYRKLVLAKRRSIDLGRANLNLPFGLSLSKPIAPFDKLRANDQLERGRLHRALPFSPSRAHDAPRPTSL